ncbi:hypothetical protein [Shewanella baltica]|uniref:hypothetical protein n=1 Tax=Shewanella baltica TaxID=62322 RepID=UPI00217D3AB5|nr:hypothetical protein [Shewanella baltica]
MAHMLEKSGNNGVNGVINQARRRTGVYPNQLIAGGNKKLGSRIELINEKQLAKLMLRYNIGSRNEQILHLKRIDEELLKVRLNG